MHVFSSLHVLYPRRRLRLLLVCCALVLAAGGAPLYADPAADREYKVKAAFIYNFLKFVVGGRFGSADDKAPVASDPDNVLLVGIVGRAPSKEGFQELQGQPVKDRRLKVQFFPGFEDLKDAQGKTPLEHPQLEALKKCQVLFFCPSEKPFLARFLPHLQRDGILLVGDVPGFLEAGGIINLLIEDNKVRFEVNLAAGGREKLQIRSSLLRLAVRTIEHDSLEEQEHEPRQAGRKGR
jgi:hypothetical protein